MEAELSITLSYPGDAVELSCCDLIVFSLSLILEIMDTLDLIGHDS